MRFLIIGRVRCLTHLLLCAMLLCAGLFGHFALSHRIPWLGCVDGKCCRRRHPLFAGRSAVERLERVLLLRVAVDGESKDMEEVACDRRFTAGELTPASSLEVSAGKADRFNGALAPLEKEAVWLPGTVDRRMDCRIGSRECLIDSSVILLSSKN